MIGGSFTVTAVVVAAVLGLVGGLVLLLISQVRHRGREETKSEISKHARQARDRMARIKPAGERGTLERLRSGKF